MERPRLSCARCGRGAVYLVRASGEPLCSRCLERSLVRGVRRSIGRYSRLDPGEPVVVVEPLSVKLWLCSSLRILVRALRSHGNRVILIGYGEYGWRCVSNRHVDRFIRIDISEVLRTCMDHGDPFDRAACVYKAEYLLGYIAAQTLGVRSVFLMRPRDLCSLLGVMGIIAMNLSLAVESIPSREAHTGIQITSPLYGVTSQDLAAYSYSVGLVDEDHLCSSSSDLEDLPGYIDIQSLYTHSSEMIYSSSEAVNEILRGIPGARCPLCSTPVEKEGYCDLCSSLLPLLKKLLNSIR